MHQTTYLVQLSCVPAWQAPSLEARLRNIVEALTFDVYNYTCLSLFECHKLMFSFQVWMQ